MYRYLWFIALFLHLSITLATPLAKEKVPDPLKPWVNWVLQNEENNLCPFFYNSFQTKHCSWPGKLSLHLKSKKANFTSQWQVYKESWIPLPGNQNHWPQNVMVNDKPALVIPRQGKPSIKLTEGLHRIEGTFFWDQIPESLAIPNKTALLNLQINGKNIPYPLIKDDVVWLKESDIGQKKPQRLENKLDLQVFRKIYDDIPLQMMTYLELEVSGDQREITLPHALLADFIPISLRSPLPARLEPDGRLLIQVRPGRWHIELNARHPQPITELSFQIKDKTWPKSEIWSFHAIPFLRVVEITNVNAIDPSQSNVPRQWKQFPAYQIKQNDNMTFKVIRRGDPEPEPNQLTLKRQLWLDFNGDAYTASDIIMGKMTKGWRINALPETQLGQVKLNGQSQLITTLNSNKQGVEVRKGSINLQADSRINGSISTISAVGWEQDFHQVQAELNIPPGWHLLATSGVDNVPNSWISKWTLLDLFVVLIAALAISRLWTVYWGLFALITLGLCWHESGAPQYIWLNILAAIALIRVLPAGKFQLTIKWYRNICWLALLVIIIPFMVSQVRIGLYPQLDTQHSLSHITDNLESSQGGIYSVLPELDAVSMSQQPMKKMRTLSSSKVKTEMTKTKLKRNIQERIDPDANIQTGPGLPQWQWKKIHLSWNGSVDSQQQIEFWYLSPTLSMIFNFIRVVLVLFLSVLMFGLVNKKLSLPRSIFSWLLLLPLMSLPSQDVYADFPNQEILNDLKNRLLKAPDCLPTCAQISQMDLSINQHQLTIKLQVHAQQAIAIPLPAQLNQWFPNQVTVNKNIAQALIRTANNDLWLSLDKGHHSVELQGVNPSQNKFSLPLPLKPHLTKVNAEGWTVEGIYENNRIDNQLIFSRVKTAQQSDTNKQKLEQEALPAFLKIERELHLGLDWRVTTRVSRTSKNETTVALKIPLISGESVTTEHTRVKNNQVLINLSPKQQTIQWESILEKTSQIDLIAPTTHQWTEVWRANVSPIWHLQSTGLSVVHHQDRGQWLPEWRPWAGEKVSLIISRPKAVKGSTLTIDRSELLTKPGKRSLETELNLSIRSSKGTQHTLTIPEGVELQSVQINGITQPIRQKNTQVTLPIKPGQQDISLNWRKTQEQSLFLTTETVNLGVASVNSHLKIALGQDRWVLFTSDSKFGPAVLFWGVLFVMLLLSIGLGKIPLTPLKHWHWFLLLIGLSQIPIGAALIVVIWLISLGLRAKKPLIDLRYFNASQVGLGLLSLCSLIILFVAVQQGLLGSPDMQIAGNHSSAFNLNWYQDRAGEQLPTATIVTVPLMSYRILMLLWSLWLAVSLLNWLKWGWNCFSSHDLWKKKEINKSSTTLRSED